MECVSAISASQYGKKVLYVKTSQISPTLSQTWKVEFERTTWDIIMKFSGKIHFTPFFSLNCEKILAHFVYVTTWSYIIAVKGQLASSPTTLDQTSKLGFGRTTRYIAVKFSRQLHYRPDVTLGKKYWGTWSRGHVTTWSCRLWLENGKIFWRIFVGWQAHSASFRPARVHFSENWESYLTTLKFSWWYLL